MPEPAASHAPPNFTASSPKTDAQEEREYQLELSKRNAENAEQQRRHERREAERQRRHERAQAERQRKHERAEGQKKREHEHRSQLTRIGSVVTIILIAVVGAAFYLDKALGEKI